MKATQTNKTNPSLGFMTIGPESRRSPTQLGVYVQMQHSLPRPIRTLDFYVYKAYAVYQDNLQPGFRFKMPGDKNSVTRQYRSLGSMFLKNTQSLIQKSSLVSGLYILKCNAV